ncbi:hypothetical protein A4X09_0g2935 [Tilletia walkeri]|uniref:Uncharacterized protein n=1 Tax=Tilletia walkeri TaxID=117179 RepID=A0A8X7T6K7_9BASI|nr:hypothetical protein A4X09_0g2935 [Tilletia walkeri]
MTIFGRPGSRSFQFPSHTPTQVYRTASRLPPLRIHAFPHGQQVSPHCPARRISTHPRGRSRLEERHPLHRQQGQSLRQLQHARVLGSRDAQIAIDAHGVGSPVTATSSASEPLIAAKPALGPTPLLAPEWKTALQRWRLEQRYPTIVSGIREGFDVGLPKIDKTFIPPNHKSATKDPATVEAKISKELAAGRYCGPFSQTECEQYLGGSFQSSSISLAPKPPDGWRFIQDASFPRDDPRHTSIKSQINSNDWPCTWSGIQTVIWQILQLPPTAQAGARDVRSAYRAINLHPSQWAAAVVQWQGRYYVDKALAFGMSSSAGAWGVVGDALADVLRAHGIGPVLKWVDDYLSFASLPPNYPASTPSVSSFTPASSLCTVVVAGSGSMGKGSSRRHIDVAVVSGLPLSLSARRDSNAIWPGGERSSSVERAVVSRSFANDLYLHDPGLFTDACGSGAGVVLDGRVAAYAVWIRSQLAQRRARHHVGRSHRGRAWTATPGGSGHASRTCAPLH